MTHAEPGCWPLPCLCTDDDCWQTISMGGSTPGIGAGRATVRVSPDLDLDGPYMNRSGDGRWTLRLKFSDVWHVEPGQLGLPQQLWPFIEGGPVYASAAPSAGSWLSGQVVLRRLGWAATPSDATTPGGSTVGEKCSQALRESCPTAVRTDSAGILHCDSCAGKHQDALKAAGCTAPEIQEWCTVGTADSTSLGWKCVESGAPGKWVPLADEAAAAAVANSA